MVTSSLTAQIDLEGMVCIQMVNQVLIFSAHIVQLMHFVKHRLNLFQVKHPIGQNPSEHESYPAMQPCHGRSLRMLLDLVAHPQQVLMMKWLWQAKHFFVRTTKNVSAFAGHC